MQVLSVTPSIQHIEKLDPQIQDFFFDWLDIYERFVPHETALTMAWRITAEAFEGVAA